jgi:hypothetical protein
MPFNCKLLTSIMYFVRNRPDKTILILRSFLIADGLVKSSHVSEKKIKPRTNMTLKG